MPPTYKLFYFPHWSRGEATRYLFSLADVPYEDVRIPFKELHSYKHASPTGKLPYLEIDGTHTLCDSQSIGRYLAREFGFNGRTSLEAAYIDMIMTTIQDMYQPIRDILFSTPPENLSAAVKLLKADGLAKLISFVEKMLASSESGWLVGDTISVADITVYTFCVDFIGEAVQHGLFDHSDVMKAFFRKCEAVPGVARWRDERPPAMPWSEVTPVVKKAKQQASNHVRAEVDLNHH